MIPHSTKNRSSPNLHQSLQIINRYSSWLDFTRLNEGSEISIIETLLQFENAIKNTGNALNADSLKELNDLKQYLLDADVDNKHIWQSPKSNEIQIDEHDAIAKYASNCIAHNSIHHTLFGSNDTANARERVQIPWYKISEMIEQSHFIRDWKLKHIDDIIQTQIDILQALIEQNATPKNNRNANSTVTSAQDFQLNLWKQHIIKLRNIRKSPKIGLVFPMNVLRFDRIKIDHLAKKGAINGIQYLMANQHKKLPPLPSIPPSPSLKLRDLLPPKVQKPQQQPTASRTQRKSTSNPIAQQQFGDDQQQRIHQKLINKVQHHPINANPPPPQPAPNNFSNNQNLNHLMNVIMSNTQNNNVDINRIFQLLTNKQLTAGNNAYLSNLLQQRQRVQLMNNANNNLLHHPPLQQRQMHSQSAQQHQPLNTNQNMLISRPVLMNNKNVKSDNDSSDIEIVKVIKNNSKVQREKEEKQQTSQSTQIDLTANSPSPILPNDSNEPIMKVVAPLSSASSQQRKEVKNEIDTKSINQVYSDKNYWTQFHKDQKCDHFEWFCDYDDIADVLDEFIANKAAKILEIGSGLSSMSSRMVIERGYSDILCLDWCQTAIDKMKKILNFKYAQSSKEKKRIDECIKYTVQDIRSMDFERRSFDVVIDKGTLDAIDCGVSPTKHGLDNLADNFEEVVAICARIHEILKSNGLFIMITSRSINKRIEFVGELKASHKRHFKKVYGRNIKTELKDWRDGDQKTPRLIILKAKKNVRKNKHQKTP